MKPIDAKATPDVTSLHSRNDIRPNLGAHDGVPSVSMRGEENFNMNQAYRCYNGNQIQVFLNTGLILETASFDIVLNGTFFPNVNGLPVKKPTMLKERWSINTPIASVTKTFPIADGWLCNLSMKIENVTMNHCVPVFYSFTVQTSIGTTIATLLGSVTMFPTVDPFPFNGTPTISPAVSNFIPVVLHIANPLFPSASFAIPQGITIHPRYISCTVNTDAVAGVRSVELRLLSNGNFLYISPTFNQNPSLSVQYLFTVNALIANNFLPELQMSANVQTPNNDKFTAGIVAGSDINDTTTDITLIGEVIFL